MDRHVKAVQDLADHPLFLEFIQGMRRTSKLMREQEKVCRKLLTIAIKKEKQNAKH